MEKKKKETMIFDFSNLYEDKGYEEAKDKLPDSKLFYHVIFPVPLTPTETWGTCFSNVATAKEYKFVLFKNRLYNCEDENEIRIVESTVDCGFKVCETLGDAVNGSNYFVNSKKMPTPYYMCVWCSCHIGYQHATCFTSKEQAEIFRNMMYDCECNILLNRHDPYDANAYAIVETFDFHDLHVYETAQEIIDGLVESGIKKENALTCFSAGVLPDGVCNDVNMPPRKVYFVCRHSRMNGYCGVGFLDLKEAEKFRKKLTNGMWLMDGDWNSEAWIAESDYTFCRRCFTSAEKAVDFFFNSKYDRLALDSRFEMPWMSPDEDTYCVTAELKKMKPQVIGFFTCKEKADAFMKRLADVYRRFSVKCETGASLRVRLALPKNEA